jgi:hypothetical protein
MAGFRVVIVGENTQWRESLTMAFRAGSTGEVIAAQSSDEFDELCPNCRKITLAQNMSQYNQ